VCKVAHARKQKRLSNLNNSSQFVRVADIITRANFGEDRRGGGCVNFPPFHIGSSRRPYSTLELYVPELSMSWIDPWVGLGRDFSVFGGLGWVGSTTAKVIKI